MRAHLRAVVRPLVLTTALTGALSLVGPAHAVTTHQSYWIPVGKQLLVRGHGFGHGHGMSQYGAQGAALQGLTYRKILNFYYPGTTWSTVTGNVRVLITSDTTSDLVVSPADGLTVRDLGTGSRYALPKVSGLKRWRISVGAGNKSLLSYLTKRWHRWHPGGRRALAGDGEFSAKSPLTLWTPSGARKYRGKLRSASPTKGSAARDTVNVLSMDKYVRGVIPSEMPASWQTEAVRAQAVAARTYASWSRAQFPKRYYQICDTSFCQVYGGLSGEDSRSNAAVRATARQILTYAGAASFTQFSSSDGGWTSAGSVPYLPAQADPYDGFAGNPVHDWSTTIDAGRLESSYPSIGTLRRIEVTSRDGNGQWKGRVWDMVLHGTDADITISGDTFRSLFGLRSSWFTFAPTPIMAHWSSLGGSRSVLGKVKSAEHAVANGARQSFAKGRIYYSGSTGAHELYGSILTTYLDLDGPKSRLHFPTTGIQQRKTGYRAKFQGGVIYAKRANRTVPVIGKIAKRYRNAGGVYSKLGWPVRTNFATPRGQRVNFEHGYIWWSRATGRTTVRLHS
jgi:stage II sporulation protein D